jgi:hypothetical protein
VSARAVIFAALVASACVRRVPDDSEIESRIASGRSVDVVRPFAGSPVEVLLTFKDGTPPCAMAGAVQFARDSVHRWVWLEPQGGCPDWLAGRWWAEMQVGGAGWVISSISSRPDAEAR